MTAQPLDAATVDRILRDAGGRFDNGDLDRSGRVATIPVQPVGRSGLSGQVARVSITYDRPTATGPRSLIVKSATTEHTDAWQLAVAEARFLRWSGATRAWARTPAVLASDLDEVAGRCHLVLEDLGDAGFVRQIDGCTAEQTYTASDAITDPHQRWLGRELPPALRSLAPTVDSPATAFIGRWLTAYPGMWRYHARLAAPGYSFDRYVADFRTALVWVVATPLALHVRRLMSGDGSWPATFPILSRCVAAIDDWSALSGV
jgi:hypothetical protein